MREISNLSFYSFINEKNTFINNWGGKLILACGFTPWSLGQNVKQQEHTAAVANGGPEAKR